MNAELNELQTDRTLGSWWLPFWLALVGPDGYHYIILSLPTEHHVTWPEGEETWL